MSDRLAIVYLARPLVSSAVWIPLLWSHGKETRVLDHELGGGSQQTGGRQGKKKTEENR